MNSLCAGKRICQVAVKGRLGANGIRQLSLKAFTFRCVPTKPSIINIKNFKESLSDQRLGSIRCRSACKIKKQLGNHRRSLKTRKAAAKRFIKTGKGGLKRGQAGKAHLNHGMKRTRSQRLNNKVRIKGSFLKKMNSLLLGKK